MTFHPKPIWLDLGPKNIPMSTQSDHPKSLGANQRLGVAMGPNPWSQNRPLVDNLPRYINQLQLCTLVVCAN